MMSNAMDVTELRVYRQSLNSLSGLYQIISKIPRSHYKLRNQLTNSGEAVPALISEGFSKRDYTKEARRFFQMAMAESDEVITHLRKLAILARMLKYITLEMCRELALEYKSISKQLNKMARTWKGNNKSSELRSPKSDI